jgi:VWFA-related protein
MVRFFRKHFIVSLVFSPLLLNAYAQDPAPQDSPLPTLTVSVKIVALDAVVHDRDGKLVLNLDKDAFTLKVDGKPTDIRYFNRDNDLPLTIGLMVDTSGSQRTYFEEEKRSCETFLTKVLTNQGDRAMVVRFDTRVLLLQKMTASLPDLRNALRLLDYRDPEIGTSQGGTLLFDAISSVSKSVASKEVGRRAVIILTDGDDNGSVALKDDAIRQAQLADVAVYSVLYTHEVFGGIRYPTAGSRPSGVLVMEQISKATGGQAFIVGTGTPIAEIFAKIERDLRSQYRFGFTPLPSKPGKYHRLDLRTGEKHQAIQTRAGYYSPN